MTNSRKNSGKKPSTKIELPTPEPVDWEIVHRLHDTVNKACALLHMLGDQRVEQMTEEGAPGSTLDSCAAGLQELYGDVIESMLKADSAVSDGWRKMSLQLEALAQQKASKK